MHLLGCTSRISSRPLRRKLLIIGDHWCGKSSLLLTFALGRFQDWHPSVHLNHLHQLTIDGQLVELVAWDSYGLEDDDRLHALDYPGTHVILIAFSVDMPDSLEHAQDKWLAEATRYAPGVPIVLVGLKTDLRNDLSSIEELKGTRERVLTHEKCSEVAAKLGVEYVECSAKNGVGLDDVFMAAARASLRCPAAA